MVYTPSAQSLRRATPADNGAPQRMVRPLDTRAGGERAVFSCDVQYLRRDGSIGAAHHRVPRTPPFLDAFTAFARGALIATTAGPVAVEDLTPGMWLHTNERGPSPLLWVGAMTMRPAACAREDAAPRLVRVMPDALGIGRPMADFMAGPGARIMRRIPGLLDETLYPVTDLVDGTHAIELRPPGAVHLYHLALHRHATITAAGLHVETFHPGPGFDQNLGAADLALFLGLFPHVSRPVDFGSLAHPRGPLKGMGGAGAI
ncbi:hypothetical protein D6850_00570 [Roseovarius spongiae]|uniref:Hedgehog/Intein (Hint) domain-containing protein n=1 Tax=Roseovarius spongiae TaxID=2320272 RepID=A0A3A8B3Q3_9RHOB|nr:Hint domain-containing protein [Roseovarius spongiae]RKF16101.1 hypothetical protein D6850_00570 [Roseovarius spongiae]